MTTTRLRRTFVSLSILAGAAACLTVVPGAGAASTPSCSGSLQATRDGVTLTARRVRPPASIACTPARRVVHDYLHAKLWRPLDSCAGPAVNPPYVGCRVDGFTCRLVAGSATRSTCTKGRLSIAFVEVDVDRYGA